MIEIEGGKVCIEEPGYIAVTCDKPLPCPFCGGEAKFCQLAHQITSQRVGKSKKYKQVKVCIIASSRILTGDTFWFRCSICGCILQKHHTTAQDAAIDWNRRA